MYAALGSPERTAEIAVLVYGSVELSTISTTVSRGLLDSGLYYEARGRLFRHEIAPY